MFHSMKYILAVYEAQGFTRAAERLGISQPSLSASVKAVENEVGTPLFERGFSPVRLTQAGKLYVETAQKMQKLQHDFVRRLGEQQDLSAGVLVLGGGSYVSSYLLPDIVQFFSRIYPQIEIRLVQGQSQELRRALLEDEVDLVLDSYDFPEAGLDRTALLSEEILLAVPRSYDVNRNLAGQGILPTALFDGANLADLPPLPVTAFAKEPFLLLKSGHDMRRRADALMSEKKMSPRVLFSVDQLSTSCAFTMAQTGISFLTDTLFRRNRYPDEAVLYRLAGTQTRRQYSLFQKHGKLQSGAMRAFCACATEYASKH